MRQLFCSGAAGVSQFTAQKSFIPFILATQHSLKIQVHRKNCHIELYLLVHFLFTLPLWFVQEIEYFISSVPFNCGTP
jgi:phosphoglycerol transferase MdoB-like AlkP superfamily enzyme